MASDVAICNQALGLLGTDPIIALTDNVKAASLCKLLYYDVRDAVLEAHDWTFAVVRAKLPASTTAPTFGFGVAYPLPANVLRVQEVNERKGGPWQVEGGSIVTNDSTCRVKYISQITDPNKFSALFVQALAARMAAELAIPLTQSRALHEQHYKIYSAKIMEAAGRDGMQGTSRRIRSQWLQKARYASGPSSTGPTV